MFCVLKIMKFYIDLVAAITVRTHLIEIPISALHYLQNISDDFNFGQKSVRK